MYRTSCCFRKCRQSEAPVAWGESPRARGVHCVHLYTGAWRRTGAVQRWILHRGVQHGQQTRGVSRLQSDPSVSLFSYHFHGWLQQDNRYILTFPGPVPTCLHYTYMYVIWCTLPCLSYNTHLSRCVCSCFCHVSWFGWGCLQQPLLSNLHFRVCPLLCLFGLACLEFARFVKISQ